MPGILLRFYTLQTFVSHTTQTTWTLSSVTIVRCTLINFLEIQQFDPRGVSSVGQHQGTSSHFPYRERTRCLVVSLKSSGVGDWTHNSKLRILYTSSCYITFKMVPNLKSLSTSYEIYKYYESVTTGSPLLFHYTDPGFFTTFYPSNNKRNRRGKH